MNTTPNISVEITTFNRADTLCTLLERLTEQTLAPQRFEVVLSDDGSQPALFAALDALLPRLPYPLRLLRHSHAGPGHAHNRGIEACAADHVLMLAADILPAPELLAEHLASHRAEPAPEVMVCGRLTQSPDLPETVFQGAADQAVEKIFQNASRQVEHGGFLVSNLSFKKAYMLEHGMFRHWPPAAGEDLELGYRLRRAGMRLVHNHNALGFHHHEETLASVTRRAYLTGYNSHHFAAVIDEPWVHRRFGTAADDSRARLRRGMRALLRRIFLNRVTTHQLMVPLMRRAEALPALIPLTPVLFEKINAYFFECGIADQRAGRPLKLPEL